METDDAFPGDAHQAREVLRQLGRDEDAVRYPPLPAWFFVLQAGAVAGIFLAQLLSPSDAHRATFAFALASIVLGSRYWLNRDGVSRVSVRFADMAVFLAAVLAVCAVCWVVSSATGTGWVWIPGAAVAAAIVLGTGHRYRRGFTDGR